MQEMLYCWRSCTPLPLTVACSDTMDKPLRQMCCWCLFVLSERPMRVVRCSKKYTTTPLIKGSSFKLNKCGTVLFFSCKSKQHMKTSRREPGKKNKWTCISWLALLLPKYLVFFCRKSLTSAPLPCNISKFLPLLSPAPTEIPALDNCLTCSSAANFVSFNRSSHVFVCSCINRSFSIICSRSEFISIVFSCSNFSFKSATSSSVNEDDRRRPSDDPGNPPGQKEQKEQNEKTSKRATGKNNNKNKKRRHGMKKVRKHVFVFKSICTLKHQKKKKKQRK